MEIRAFPSSHSLRASLGPDREIARCQHSGAAKDPFSKLHFGFDRCFFDCLLNVYPPAGVLTCASLQFQNHQIQWISTCFIVHLSIRSCKWRCFLKSRRIILQLNIFSKNVRATIVPLRVRADYPEKATVLERMVRESNRTTYAYCSSSSFHSCVSNSHFRCSASLFDQRDLACEVRSSQSSSSLVSRQCNQSPPWSFVKFFT